MYNDSSDEDIEAYVNQQIKCAIKEVSLCPNKRMMILLMKILRPMLINRLKVQ